MTTSLFSMGRPTFLLQTPMVQRHRPDRCIRTLQDREHHFLIRSYLSWIGEVRGRQKPDDDQPSASIDRSIDESELPGRGYRKATSWWRKREDAMCPRLPAQILNEARDMIDVVDSSMGVWSFVSSLLIAESLKPMSRLIAAWAACYLPVRFNLIGCCMRCIWYDMILWCCCSAMWSIVPCRLRIERSCMYYTTKHACIGDCWTFRVCLEIFDVAVSREITTLKNYSLLFGHC